MGTYTFIDKNRQCRLGIPYHNASGCIYLSGGCPQSPSAGIHSSSCNPCFMLKCQIDSISNETIAGEACVVFNAQEWKEVGGTYDNGTDGWYVRDHFVLSATEIVKITSQHYGDDAYQDRYLTPYFTDYERLPISLISFHCFDLDFSRIGFTVDYQQKCKTCCIKSDWTCKNCPTKKKADEMARRKSITSGKNMPISKSIAFAERVLIKTNGEEIKPSHEKVTRHEHGRRSYNDYEIERWVKISDIWVLKKDIVTDNFSPKEADRTNPTICIHKPYAQSKF